MSPQGKCYMPEYIIRSMVRAWQHDVDMCISVPCNMPKSGDFGTTTGYYEAWNISCTKLVHPLPYTHKVDVICQNTSSGPWSELDNMMCTTLYIALRHSHDILAHLDTTLRGLRGMDQSMYIMHQVCLFIAIHLRDKLNMPGYIIRSMVRAWQHDVCRPVPYSMP